ncbi:MAG: ribonuclease Z [Bacteroidetes bacterium]|nr:ribonuclease Z [Bacteroidota bacterium]
MTFSVTILGCNSAIPFPGRNPSAQVVNFNEKYYLIDCAEGTQMQMRKYGVPAQRINHVFISHIHGDHFFGLIGLISTYNLLERKSDLHIYGPPELEQIIAVQLEASATQLIYSLHFHPLKPDNKTVIFEDNELSIMTVPLNHRIPTCGFIFQEKIRPRNIKKGFLDEEKVSFDDIRKIKSGEDYLSKEGTLYKNSAITFSPPKPRCYAYISDTSYFESIIEQISGADLLYHESTFMQDKAATASEKYHSTSVEAATVAVKAKVKRLLLGHFSNRYDDLQPLLQEARTVFPESFLALDGEVFKIAADYRNKAS